MRLANLTSLLLITALGCCAATVTVCTSGCTTTSLQAAFDSVSACGDTIQIKSTETQTGNYTITYRGCGSNPITVTSDRASYLPAAGQRITPSHLGNMAKIYTSNASESLAGILDGSNRPPAGWNFVGVAFSTSALTYHLVSFNYVFSSTVGCDHTNAPSGNDDGCAANSSQIADNITFDRCYFFMASNVGNASNLGIQAALHGDVTNLTVKNSYFGDGFYNGFVESHAIEMRTTAGPVTFTNNFITTASEPIFSGGAIPSYGTYLENGVTAQYNYLWRPWKYNGDPNQPHAADYVTWAQGTLRQALGAVITNVSNTGVLTIPSAPYLVQGSMLTITGVGGCTVANAPLWRISILSGTTFQLLNFPGCNSAYTSGGSINEYAVTVCNKNLGEMKWATGVTWQYNMGENSWYNYNCQSQWNGFTDTLRPTWDAMGVVMSFTTANSLTWTGSYRIGSNNPGDDTTHAFLGDIAVCVSMPTTGTECHPISSYSGASLITAVSFSAAPGGTYDAWISYTGSAKLENVTLTHNVYKNVDTAYGAIGVAFANGVGDAGYGKTHVFSQNLIYADSSYIVGRALINLMAAEADDSWSPYSYTLDHNTLYYPNGTSGWYLYANGTGCSSCSNPTKQPPFDTSAITNNLVGVSSTGNGISGDGTGNIDGVALGYFTNSNIKNNWFPGATVGAGSVGTGNTVSGNIVSTWTDAFNGGAATRNFTVAAASAAYHAGTDGASLGADMTQLPLIQNLVVTNNVLNFDLTSGINSYIKNTQPMTLEVSSNQNLQNDLGTYAVIATVDPVATAGADSSLRSDVVLAGTHVTWPLNGVTPGTVYYGRIMGAGDTEQFSFTAVAVGASVSSSKRTVSSKSVAH